MNKMRRKAKALPLTLMALFANCAVSGADAINSVTLCGRLPLFLSPHLQGCHPSSFSRVVSTFAVHVGLHVLEFQRLQVDSPRLYRWTRDARLRCWPCAHNNV
jgi:hypothetical protein